MNAPFLNRFQLLWRRKRRVQLGQVLASSLLLALVGVGALVALDYRWELEQTVRSALLGGLLLSVVLFSIRSLWRTVSHWSQPNTAAEIEAAFPQLGQSVRTTVQFGTMRADETASEGVAPTLVTALANETHRRALPLTLEDVLPTQRLAFLVASVIAVGALLIAATSLNWEWSYAAQRAFLHEQPYRELIVAPGNHTVAEGDGLRVEIDLVGRADRDVVLFTRVAGSETEWLERKVELDTAVDQSNVEAAKATVANRSAPKALWYDKRQRVRFVETLARLTKDMEYRVTAGELQSPTYHVSIRRPLRMENIQIELTPPEYTGQVASTVDDANVSALQGTSARFVIKFDKPVKAASLVLAPKLQPRDEDDANEPVVIPLKLNSEPSATATLSLVEDRTYRIVAVAVDGTTLPDNKYRIRVQQDQPPQVSFESPDDSVEVHTLAELLMRVRVSDDYGLSRTGVVFQVNNEQEIPLINEDFSVVVAAAEETATTGKLSPKTKTLLERILPLEHFELTQKDSVLYYAFAEDNVPGKPQRTESDMRFIDIRPFKREYRVVDPDPMDSMPGNGLQLKSLEELISRQRFGLNRTIQIEKRAALGRKPDASALNQLMEFEKDLATNVRETALGLEARGFDDTELFYQAETAMLAAVDSLSVGKWENATLQMKDALKALIEQRDRTVQAIMKNPQRAQVAAIRAFDRMQAQKLRRPKTDKEEARELIRRLEALAAEEDAVAKGLVPVDESNAPAN